MKSRVVSAPAPVAGLVLGQSPVAPKPGSAEFLENYIPTDRGLRVRGGLQASATVGASALSLFAYRDASLPALFASTASSIFDISAFDPDNIPTADVTGQTSGYYSAQQIGVVGGNYLYAVNGSDNAQLYDGSSWVQVTGVSTPAITGVDTSNFSQVWLYRNRLFFVEKDTLKAWYLPVDSIGGAAQSVSLAGIFKNGGSLLFGATWSLDSGDGLDDKCVFVSTEGEVAIYEGADPSSASDWRNTGRYDVAKPLGVNCTMQAGGDLLLATIEGIVPLSQVIQKDPAAIALSAVSRDIEPLWEFEARRATQPVELIKWPDRGLGLVTLPDSDQVLVVNLQTGAWAPQTGWVANCGETFQGKAYIGRADGSVCAVDETGMDVSSPYTARVTFAFSDFGRVSYKVAQQLRATFYAPSEFAYKMSVANDYNASDFPSSPADAGVAGSDEYLVWDTGNWDEKLWWSEAVQESTRGFAGRWVSVSGAGSVLAPQLQITSGSTTKPNIELVRIDMTFQEGSIVT